MSLRKAWMMASLVPLSILVLLVTPAVIYELADGGSAILTVLRFMALGLLFVLALVSLIAVPLTASNKGRSPLLWFIAAWFLTVWAWMAIRLVAPRERITR